MRHSIITMLLLCALFGASRSTYACIEKESGKQETKRCKVKTDESVVATEYYTPAKVSAEKRKSTKIFSVDSILAAAKEKFNAEANAEPVEDSYRARIEAETEWENYTEKAEAILHRTRVWADSVCNLFRRPTFSADPEKYLR